MAEARELFERVLKLQPDNVDARAGVAATDIFEAVNGYYPRGNEERLELDPFIGAIPLRQVHMGALQEFIAKRTRDGVKNKSINAALAGADRACGRGCCTAAATSGSKTVAVATRSDAGAPN
jgi:hypothetical protein